MTRSLKGIGNSVYKLEYWNVKKPHRTVVTEPYDTKNSAKGRLTGIRGNNPENKYDGRVLELTGEWVEVD